MPEWDRRGPSKRLGDIMGREGIREYAAIYHGMVKYIDDQVGRVLAKLDELGLADNTLVIFTTDHGDMVGAHGCIGKSIFSFYDDLVRIPLLMRLPGRIPAGTVVTQAGQPDRLHADDPGLRRFGTSRKRSTALRCGRLSTAKRLAGETMPSVSERMQAA